MTEHILELMLQCIFFINDIVLVGESREKIKKLELWRQVLQAYDFCLSRSKTEYMKCNFSMRHTNSILGVKIGVVET